MKFKYVDIAEYVNNKLFMPVQSKDCSILHENIGEMFDVQSLVSQTDIDFDLSYAYSNHYDSIFCEGQTIELETEHYNYLAILATAFWDNCHEEIEFFSRGFRESMQFDVSCAQNIANEFSYDKYKDTVAFFCKEVEKGYSRYIYTNYFAISKNTELQIKLPYNPSILICGISLISKDE